MDILDENIRAIGFINFTMQIGNQPENKIINS